MKVERAAFLYLNPKGAPPFAQCTTCMMWTGPQKQRCTIHGSELTVRGTDTCGFYIHGKPMPAAHVMKSVTTEESGFERRAVRCENCAFFNDAASRCRLFTLLNEMAPRLFALDDRVHPQGCCNANTPLPRPETY